MNNKSTWMKGSAPVIPWHSKRRDCLCQHLEDEPSTGRLSGSSGGVKIMPDNGCFQLRTHGPIGILPFVFEMVELQGDSRIKKPAAESCDRKNLTLNNHSAMQSAKRLRKNLCLRSVLSVRYDMDSPLRIFPSGLAWAAGPHARSQPCATVIGAESEGSVACPVGNGSVVRRPLRLGYEYTGLISKVCTCLLC
ncbi:hypothetical protein PAXRUDRAFT_374783 [Paxillus rubicundulus Ve08.2h10]|uniref:Uncharacterized protein n=1 Tax=Paxillus rubicundulus Ve08.2h10 TaxID=930991 RepID=A0A0D0E988_9AGAM|nr:hypothetical protein PAXRUDRAFT_374783 [Paxillus rubicundulus Ve08.2h10]